MKAILIKTTLLALVLSASGCSTSKPVEEFSITPELHEQPTGLGDGYGQFHFEVGQSELVEAKPKIDTLLRILHFYPELKVHLSGHADASGEDLDNLKLSEARVLAVYHELKAHGLTDDRIRTDYFGEGRPICSNETEEGRACNRSVVVYLR